MWVREGEAYSLHFSVSRSLDSCLRAFSVSPTTASTPFSCVSDFVCVYMCVCVRVCVWGGGGRVVYMISNQRSSGREGGREGKYDIGVTLLLTSLSTG